MKIEKVHIKNFRSIKDLEFRFPESGIMVLVGANNAGKSNIVRAINNILGESWWGKNIDEVDFYMRIRRNTIEIEIEFDNGKRVEFNSKDGWPKYFDENGNLIKSNKGSMKEDFPCTYLSAERGVSQTLSFNKWSLMGKVAQSFNKLIKEKNKAEELENKFMEVMNILEQVEEFRRFKEDFVNFFEEMQADTPYKLKVDFKPFSPLNYFKTINILANDNTLGDKYDIDIEELGEGNRNLMILSLLRSYAKNFKKQAQGLLIIEEPEIYMHPQARKHLLKVFKEIVKNSDIQIMITTHSSTFIETEHFENIALVYKTKETGTKIRQVFKKELADFSNKTGAGGKSTTDNIVEFYSITSDEKLKEAFFAKKVILVEGDTEEICLPVLLGKVGIDINQKGISIIGVEGKTQIPKYWRLFYKFNIPMLIIFDNDISKPEKEKNNGIIANCFKLSIEDIEKCEIFKVVNGGFDQKLIVFNNNFETASEEDFKRYCDENELDNRFDEFKQEAEKLGLRKAQKHRYILRKISEQYVNYRPKYLEEIKKFIEFDEQPTDNQTVSKNVGDFDDNSIPF